MPYTEIVTPVDPEQSRLWAGFVRSSPSRVCHALSLGFHDRPNPFGDTLADFYPALAAVDEAATTNDERWRRLVDIGVADVLCINIVSTKMKNYLQDLPSGSTDPQDIPSSFAKPMTILLHTALQFSSPPTGTDAKVITALKKYWSMMMTRLLREPEHSLKPGKMYSFERATPAKLFTRILIADASFIHVLDNERDYTLSLMSRYWAYGTGSMDVLHTTLVLSNFVDEDSFNPDVPASPGPFTPSTFIRIMQGANSVRNIISSFASHFDSYLGTDSFVEISLLTKLWSIAVRGTHPLYSELLIAHRESLPLWTSIFSLLRRAVDRDRSLDRQGLITDHIGVILPLTFHMASTMLHCAGRPLKECTDLIECWAAADLFDTLDVVIPACASEQLSFSEDFLNHLAGVFSAIDIALKNAPTIPAKLRSQFPRARSFRALVDLSRTTGNRTSPAPAQNEVPSQPCWMLFRNVEEACTLKGECSRRGCDQKRTAQCVACKKVGYCGGGCQKSDWQEHKRVCRLNIEG